VQSGPSEAEESQPKFLGGATPFQKTTARLEPQHPRLAFKSKKFSATILGWKVIDAGEEQKNAGSRGRS